MGNAIDYSDWKQEKINGKIYYMSPIAHPKHGMTISNLHLAFANYLKGKPCKVFTDNIAIYLDEENNNYVVPDLSVLCDSSKFKANGYHGIPNLVIEVISPSSIKRDKVEKFNLYEHFKIPEYWLVDYRSETIEQYILIDGHYKLIDAITLLSDVEYNEVLTNIERENYTTIITPTIFKDLEIDIKEIFSL